MKKFIFGLIATVMFGFVGNAQKATSKIKPIVVTTFEPGSFSAGVFGCWGSGCCRRDIVVMAKYGMKPGTLLTNNLDGTLTIDFDFSSFSKENVEYYSKRDTFVMENDFTLNSEETKKLELNDNTRIITGEYRITKGSKYYSVVVNLK